MNNIRFLGVGISAAVGLSLFTIMMIIMLKVVTVKYQTPLTDVIQTI
jgi:hypothetical protein